MDRVAWGIVGFGNMGSAIFRGIGSNDALRESCSVNVLAHRKETLAAIETAGGTGMLDPQEFVRSCAYIILAVKPYQMDAVLETLRPFLQPEQVVISIASGISLNFLRKGVQDKCAVVRAMPNTLVAINSGSFAVTFDAGLADGKKAEINRLMTGLGNVVELPESSINAFAAFAGCGPAFVYYCAEAMIEAGVTLGFSRLQSREIALGLLEGSAKMARQTGKHPSLLREEVTSPGGMTIAGTNHLDRQAARSALAGGILAAFARGEEMEQ